MRKKTTNPPAASGGQAQSKNAPDLRLDQRPVILDNRTATMADYLCDHLSEAEEFRIVSAYFSVFGFGALADKLEAASLKKVRFLFGSPESASDIFSGDKAQRTFELTESELSYDDGVLVQRSLAERCIKWIKQPSVQVREIVRQNFLHGKMYHMESPTGGAATVGSSNFTLHGLGKSQNPNIEINLATTKPDDLNELARWFDELWQEEQSTRDARKKVLDVLKRWHDEYSPEFVYYKTLFDLFYEEFQELRDKDDASVKSLGNSQIWNALYEFQKDGAKSVIARLQRHNGCILADSVGLGKTYTALAVIKYFELRNNNVLVLCPKKLENNWRTYQASAYRANNPFSEDKFSYALLGHTDLSRYKGQSGDIDLANFNWGAYRLVVIDESHNFRNATKSRTDEITGERISHSRYERLMEEVIRAGADTKVLMLSATPVNTSLADLKNQIYLMTGAQDDTFKQSLGLPSIKGLLEQAQKKFQDWQNTDGKKKKEDLLAALDGNFFTLLGGVTIARSRQQIRHFYKRFIKKKGDFPKREKPLNEHPHTDSEKQFSYDQLSEDFQQLKFHLYRPSDYVINEELWKKLDLEAEEHNITRQGREKGIATMMYINFLKRLESSAHACRLTLERTLTKINNQIDKIDRFIQHQENADVVIEAGDEEEEDEDFIVDHKYSYKLSDLDVKKWRADLLSDQEALQAALNKVQEITPERDGKLTLLKQHIRQKAKKPNRKLLVFTAFKDTAEYLYQQVQEVADQAGIKAAYVAGDNTSSGSGKDAFSNILKCFAPKAQHNDGITPGEEIDLLIATDCISEGQNLQDCDSVLNYDIHWNPVRLIQRFGRIDRIGSENRSVQMINYWPTEDMDAYLDLEGRVRARAALVNVAGTGDDDHLNDDSESAQTELNFRDEQLREIREEIKDLEEVENVISLSDLTLDHFISQLMRYLEQNRKKLEEAPPGIYAVTDTDGNTKDCLKNGAIFFFRQRDAGENTTHNPKHPFYLVHVEGNQVRHGYLEMRRILRLFESLAAGKDKPLNRLCDAFMHEMNSEEGKALYDAMAKAAADDINKVFNRQSAKQLAAGSGRGGRLPKSRHKPGSTNLELITWLVIKEEA